MMDFCRISGAVAVSVCVGSRAQSHKPRLLFRTTRPPSFVRYQRQMGWEHSLLIICVYYHDLMLLEVHIQQRLRAQRATEHATLLQRASSPRYLSDHPCSPQHYLLSLRASCIFRWERWQDLCVLRPRVPTAHSSTRRRRQATILETYSECLGDHFQGVAGESSEGPQTGRRRSGSRFMET